VKELNFREKSMQEESGTEGSMAHLKNHKEAMWLEQSEGQTGHPNKEGQTL
jgi:hypothetical protein